MLPGSCGLSSGSESTSSVEESIGSSKLSKDFFVACFPPDLRI